ncbi:exopolysaccharide biosynthesis polyprenyl glycosylphosphotransferase [Streptomyces fulvoviolaceus]|uniref:exopolysaccharide biosynthesis polyprenyl glycosylphosphotransferase n=1 Tax=Streptomyces fulvoviolaceus TaxID=285535 RepID=UPI000693A7BD|nr:exopolysaccharide biosynthesis polyprenyl glycosylphosphotransferase [Streptomyces fulvoviolaceus]MCT9078356.1 exopolysaccharide biosynthesis polyprenyl glycosylphosphotransferase [Streptomyces fulvoviolaceus]
MAVVVVNETTGTGPARTTGGVRKRHRRGSSVPGLLAVDTLAAAVAAGGVYLLFHRWFVPAVFVPLWLLALASQRVYGPDADAERFRRILRAACLAAAMAGAAWWFAPRDELLHDALTALPLAAGATLGLRRYRQARMRTGRGRNADRVLVLGPAESAAELIAALRRGHAPGPQIVGVCRTGPAAPDGGAVDLLKAVRRSGCDAVIALPGPELGAERLRQLSWELRAAGVDLMLAPVLADVTARRLAVRPVAGVPLLQLRAPRISALPRIPKELTDRLLAVLGILLLAPLMVAIAAWVRLDSPGPAFFRERRIGRDSREFTLLKFRTMHRGADRRKAELAHLNRYGSDRFFKIADDPRVTRAGSILRSSSLDELPQLFNVAAGHMSLVGPRPLVKDEVTALSEDASHRLLVKPGMSGLWQVSGRSCLPADERDRLDVSYVENWSPALDLSILLRTPSAVVRRTGAC